MNEEDDGGGGGGVGDGGGGTGGGGDDGGAGGLDDDRRSVRHHGRHHKMAPPNRWSSVGSADGRPGAAVGHHHRHDMLVANRNDTAAARTSPHVLHAAPDSMCYTTNEVLVIIAVTCFLNFAFILLIMTCVHCFTDPSHHKKFGTVAYAELGDELFDTDMIDGDTVTLLNPTKSQDANDYLYEKKSGFNEYDLESCAPYQSLLHDHRCKSRMKSEEDLYLFE